MKLLLTRKEFNEKATIGHLSVDGSFSCLSLEDVVHDGEKIPGATAIPYGTYEIVLNYSERFKRVMPLLLHVPSFVGIRIHPGNSDVNTDGCILVGTVRANDDFILHSRLAFNTLFSALEQAAKTEKIFIEVTK